MARIGRSFPIRPLILPFPITLQPNPGVIAFDNKTNGNITGVHSSLSFTHAIGATNPHPYLEVHAGVQDTSTAAVTGVTCNGVAMTQVGTARTSNNNHIRSSYWSLPAPPTGTVTIVITTNVNVTDAISGEAISYTGVDQVTPVDASASGGTTDVQVAATVTTVTDKAWATLLLGADTTVLARTNSSLVVNGFVNGNGGAIFNTQAHGAITPAGNFTLAVAFTSQAYQYLIVALRPYTATTTTKTETGIARITATTQKTETGVARITATTTKTETGVSRITATTAKTETGISRITATTQKTETGVARITATTTKTETGVARITNTTTKTETGVSRITATTSKTETGVSRITATTTKTETGTARITATTSKTETGVARIQVTTAKTQTGVARIVHTSTQTETGTARITATTTKTQTGVARITNTTTKTETGISRIQVTTTRTETGVARITATTNKIETGTARITATATKTETGISRIQVITTKTETGVARITATTTRTETGVARIQRTTTQTETGISRITGTVLKTETGVARVTATTTRNETGVARVQVTTTKTQTGVARIIPAIPFIGVIVKLSRRIFSTQGLPRNFTLNSPRRSFTVVVTSESIIIKNSIRTFIIKKP